MKQRILSISDFRNLGVSRLDDEDYNLSKRPEYLILNSNYEGDKMGGLVIVIGENNTGKSNLARALGRFSYEDGEVMFDHHDKPDYMGYDGNPRLKLDIKHHVLDGHNPSNKADIPDYSIARVYKDDEGDIVHSFCNETEALRAAIRVVADKLESNQSISLGNASLIRDTLRKANKSSGLKELTALYAKLGNLLHRERLAQSLELANKLHEQKLLDYNKQIDSMFHDLKRIAEDAIAYFDELSNNILDNSGLRTWGSIKKRVLNTKEYSNLVREYLVLEKTVNGYIDEYNNKRGYRVPSLNHLEFITPKQAPLAPVKPELREPSPQYESTDDILQEAFGDPKCRVQFVNFASKSRLPRIIKYDGNEGFGDKDIKTTCLELASSVFFVNFLSSINSSVDAVKTVYKKEEDGRAGYLKECEKDLNKRIAKAITKKFNDLYGKSGEESYRF